MPVVDNIKRILDRDESDDANHLDSFLSDGMDITVRISCGPEGTMIVEELGVVRKADDES